MYLTSLFLLKTAQTREFPTVLITTRTNITVVMAASADSDISSVCASLACYDSVTDYLVQSFCNFLVCTCYKINFWKRVVR